MTIYKINLKRNPHVLASRDWFKGNRKNQNFGEVEIDYLTRLLNLMTIEYFLKTKEYRTRPLQIFIPADRIIDSANG